MEAIRVKVRKLKYSKVFLLSGKRSNKAIFFKMLRIQDKFSKKTTKNIKSNGVMKFLKINAIKAKERGNEKKVA